VEEGAGVSGRRGGAGPSDALFLYVRGLPLTVPQHASYVAASPYTLRLDGAKPSLYRGDEYVGPVGLPRRPKIYDMETADGIPYWKIALLHLDSIASTVVQKCIYWGTPEQCGFCGIELTRGEQTIPVKTPAQLAEVCSAAHELDGAVDATLTTGSINRRDRGALYISRCAAAIKDACGMPVQVQFEPPTTWRCSTTCTARASTPSASTSRPSTPTCSRAWPRARRSAGWRATSARGSGRWRSSAAAG
jgi:radical SAM protein (TIGR04043 family)